MRDLCPFLKGFSHSTALALSLKMPLLLSYFLLTAPSLWLSTSKELFSGYYPWSWLSETYKWVLPVPSSAQAAPPTPALTLSSESTNPALEALASYQEWSLHGCRMVQRFEAYPHAALQPWPLHHPSRDQCQVFIYSLQHILNGCLQIKTNLHNCN